jgi:hypothetical protein
MLLGTALSLGFLGCTPSTTPEPVTANVGAPAASPEPTGPKPLPPATAREAELAARLQATVRHFATEIGERNVNASWQLASATDDIARTLEKMGYDVRRQGIAVGDDVVQNLEVASGGGRHGDETIVVGAHFDTAAGTPGADDDASGVAAALELARSFREKKTSRVVRFSFFANGEAPYFKTAQMGSLVYAKDLRAHGSTVVGMIDLVGLGVFSTAPSSQHSPKDVAAVYPPTADFVAVTGGEPSRSFVEQLAQAMHKYATLPVVSSVLSPGAPGVGSSDDWAFSELGIPAAIVTDTTSSRYAEHHLPTDVPDRLDYDRMARVVAGLEKSLDDLLVGAADPAGTP